MAVNRLIVARVWPMLGPGSADRALPRTQQDFAFDVVQMLSALCHLQYHIEDDPVGSGPQNAIHCLLLYSRRVQRTLPKFSKRIPDYRPVMPAIAGCVAQSYQAVALRLCLDRAEWLVSQFVSVEERERRPANLSDWKCAELYAGIITGRFNSAAQHWPFDLVDTNELTMRIRLEWDWADRPEATPKGKRLADAPNGVTPRGKAGRRVTTDAMGKFAFERRNKKTPDIWKEIVSEWNAKHPNASGKATNSAMRGALNRYCKRKKKKRT